MPAAMEAVIRLASAGDAAAIAAIYRPFVEKTHISFEEQAPDSAEMARRIAGVRPGFYPWMVAEAGGRILGFGGSSAYRARPAYRWTVETAIYVEPAAHGRGLGRVLLTQLLSILEQQGFVAAIGAIALPNDPSVALHEKLGFVHTATYRGVGFKLGRWIDVGRWQRDLAPRVVHPSEPLPYAEVRHPSLEPGSAFSSTE
ncbi:MAG: GNAT family N-acetyltransferase [Sphingomicrobium sp.]